MPYIPVCERFRNILQSGEQNMLLGGVLISEMTTKIERKGGYTHTSLDLTDFRRFFGERAIACTDLDGIARATNVSVTDLALHPAESVSLVPAYKKISDADMKLYLEREISFYLAQGCNKACDFCSAPNAQKERYRDTSVVRTDLEYLTARAKRLGLSQLSMYLSNLDVFQNPEELEVFFDIINDLKRSNPDFQYRIRGLAITSSIVDTRRRFRGVLEKAVSAGFHTVGMGVDGGNDEIRRNLHKGFVSDANILESMEICNEYGITPETIMVFGGPDETEKSLKNAYEVTKMLQEKFGAIPRPHVFKDLIPGNAYWSGAKPTPKALERKELLFQNPEYCQAMDFKALASSVCHPDPVQAELVNTYYRKQTELCIDPRDHDALIYPIAPECSPEEKERRRKDNIGRFDR